MNRPESPISDARATAPWPSRRLDMLVVSVEACWPLDREAIAVACKVARALRRRGKNVAIASLEQAPGAAQAWLQEMVIDWPVAQGEHVRRFFEGWAGIGKDLRFAAAARLGLKATRLAGVVAMVERHRPRLVLAVGKAGPALLAGAKAADPGMQAVWLSPDNAGLTHLSRAMDLSWKHRPKAIAKALSSLVQPLAFAGHIDQTLGTCPLSSAALAVATLSPSTATLRRGVNLDRFRPAEEPIRPCTAVTWASCLDDPAITDSLCRFGRNVWPILHEHFPDARWRIVGPNASRPLQSLNQIDGIRLVGPLADPRTYIQRSRICLWPGRSIIAGGKPILEGLALGVPTVLTRTAAWRLGLGLHQPKIERAPALAAMGRRSWVDAIARIWADPQTAHVLSQNARAWAAAHADWSINATGLIESIDWARRHEPHRSAADNPKQQCVPNPTPRPFAPNFNESAKENETPLRQAA